MANYIIQDTTLIAIADSIRAKTGSNETMLPSDMPTAIEGITGGADGCATVTFMNGSVELLSRPVYIGDDCPDPVEQGRIDRPTKESTVDTVYSHNGWTSADGGTADGTALQNITKDKTVYAAFEARVRTYTVRFYDGDTLLKTEQVAYGGSSEYTYQKGELLFNGWTPEPANITGDMDCYGEWIDKPTFANSSWETIAAVSESGQAASIFNVGDTRDITVTYADGSTETITLEIADFNRLYTTFDANNTSTGENDVTAGLAIVAKNLLAQDRALHSGDEKIAAFDNYSSRSCDLWIWLNNDFYNALPADFASVLKDHYQCYNLVSLSQYDSYYAKVLLPTLDHMFTSGKQLQLYETKANRAKTKYGSDTGKAYWLGTDAGWTGFSQDCYIVHDSGSQGTRRQTISATGVCPMFAI